MLEYTLAYSVENYDRIYVMNKFTRLPHKFRNYVLLQIQSWLHKHLFIIIFGRLKLPERNILNEMKALIVCSSTHIKKSDKVATQLKARDDLIGFGFYRFRI